MRRRDFITLLGGAAAAWPLAARAQQPRIPVIGFLYNTTVAGLSNNRVFAFRQGLNEVGFSETRNVAIEFHFAEDRLDRLPAMAANLVRRRVAAIVTNGISLPTVMAETSTIPIVFVGGTDPVKQGLVTSLNRPSGNVTGVSHTAPALNQKRLELLHELIPKPTAIAVLLDPNNEFEAQLQDVGGAARALGRQIVVVRAASESEFDSAFATIVQAGAGALFVGTGAFLVSRRRQLVRLAAQHALPTSYPARESVEVGGLMSYGPSTTDAYRRAGTYVGRILKGEKPSDLPIELPSKYELVLNLATAKALKLEIPPKLRALADEVIE